MRGTDVSANLHVREGADIRANGNNGSHWLDLGGVGVFFSSLDDIDRTLAALCDLSIRMSASALTGVISAEPAPSINGKQGGV
jgi:hypothetical protein